MSLQPFTRPAKYQADWPQPFTSEEYVLRRKNVAGRLIEQGFDGMLVTSPADIYYLTGYDMIWFHWRFLTSCFISADGSEVQFFDYPGHTTLVETTPEIKHINWMTREDPEHDASDITAGLLKQGFKGKRIALQPWGYIPHKTVMDTLRQTIEAAGISTGDGSLIVEETRLYKTQAEVAVMRQAATIADNAMAAARDIIAPGVKETELHATIMYNMLMAGGGDPAIRCMIGSGPRAGTHHSPAQHRAIETNELVFIDFCSSLHRYHVNLNRTYALGEVDPRWHDLSARSQGTIDEIISQVKPGDPWTKVQQVGDSYTKQQQLNNNVWFVGGYAQGIAMPPDWVGEYWVDPRQGISDRELVPGMVFNFEGQFDDKAGWSGGSGFAYIDSIIVTETGLEVLSQLPRTLVTV